MLLVHCTMSPIALEVCECFATCLVRMHGLSTGWALNRCFAWTFGTVTLLARGGGYNPGLDIP